MLRGFAVEYGMVRREWRGGPDTANMEEGMGRENGVQQPEQQTKPGTMGNAERTKTPINKGAVNKTRSEKFKWTPSRRHPSQCYCCSLVCAATGHSQSQIRSPTLPLLCSMYLEMFSVFVVFLTYRRSRSRSCAELHRQAEPVRKISRTSFFSERFIENKAIGSIFEIYSSWCDHLVHLQCEAALYPVVVPVSLHTDILGN